MSAPDFPRRAASDVRDDPTAPPHHCRNCGAAAPGNYCPQCGQETSLALPSAGAFLREAAGRYVAVDGRMWRSLHALLFRPGFLTREYLAGRRRRYVRPARLFVALSIVFFAVLRFESSGDPMIVDRDPPAAAGSLPTVSEPTDAQDEKLGIRLDRDHNVRIDAGGWNRLAPLKRRVDAFNRLSNAEKAEQVRAGMFRYAPYAAIGLLPLFALLLQLVYAGSARRHPSRPRRYAAHLVFGAHTHAFAFLAATLYIVVDVGALRAPLAIWMAVYSLVSLKVVYGGGWLGVVLRALALSIAYLAFYSVAMAGLVVAAVMLR